MGADAKTAMKIEMTDAAARRIAKIVSGETGKTALRVSVEGGGCSGFSYKFDLVDTRNDDDVAIEKDGATVLIDDLSLVYMG
ncbi:MAG: iron-sulfur cluster assembly accessory protein, partial [Mesorhizobium sp.]